MIESLKARAVRIKRGVVGTWRQIHIDADPDHRKTTVLAGSGRGGTTWLAELINYENDYRFMFDLIEPILRRHDGRPHWGKLHSLVARDLAPLYPRWSEAMKVRRMLDPAGRLLNPYLKRLLDND